MSSSSASTFTKKRTKKSNNQYRSSPLCFFREPPSALFPTTEEVPRLLAVVAIAASVAAACHLAAGFIGRPPKPFCDSGDPFQDPLSGDIRLLDTCEPCPEHGHCSDGKLECFKGYRRHGWSCIENGEINRTANELSEWVERHVCDMYAQLLCYGTGKIWVQEADILKAFDESKLAGIIELKDDAFTLAKNKAMQTVESSLETRASLNGNREFKCPDVFAELHKPFSCRIRQWIYKHVLLIAAVCIILVVFTRFLWSLWRKHALSVRAEELYEQVCEILEENAMMARNATSGGEPWVVASWLRDHLLLPRERKKISLWKKVEELILEDSRIDQYPRLMKGESKIVFEWQVGSSLGSKIRKSGAAKKVNFSNRTSTPSPLQQRQIKQGDLYS